MESWKKEYIRKLFHYSALRMNIEAAFLIKHPNVPTKLYKYRYFSDCHKSALENDVLYMCSPDRFNDPYDTTIYFDPDRFLMEDYTLAEFQDMIAELQAANTRGEKWRPSPIKRPISAQRMAGPVSGRNFEERTKREGYNSFEHYR